MDREAIYSALFALLSAIPGIVTFSRRVRHWTDVPPVEQPALIQEQFEESARYVGRAFPAKWTLSLNLALYVNVGNDQQAAPSQTLNPLLDAVLAALDAPPGPGGADLRRPRFPLPAQRQGAHRRGRVPGPPGRGPDPGGDSGVLIGEYRRPSAFICG